ncbi:esterase [Sulfolobus acidocaldarius SUSAZ]|nr:esterase [Sulfolobus acidocaldarius SUSAZ]
MLISSEELNERLKQEEVFNFIGIRFEKVENGYSLLKFDFDKRLTRLGGMLHGGIMFSAIDYAGSMAVLSLSEVKDEVTAELKINFLKPMNKGPFTVEAKVVNKGNKLVTVQIYAYDGDKELCAVGLGTWSIYRF